MTSGLLSRKKTNIWSDRDHVKAMLDGLPVSAVVCDTNLEVVYVSPRAIAVLEQLRQPIRQRFGVDVDRLMGMNIHRFHQDPAAVERTMYSPGGLPCESVFELGGRHIKATICAVCDEGGDVIGYSAVIDDVTDRSRLEAGLTAASTTLTDSSEEVATAVAHLDGSAEQVRGSSESMTEGVASLLQLMHSVADGADAIREATLATVDSAHAATTSVDELNDSSNQIGEFTKLITAIAEQTKLLALNATIEATRAGEAGNGFAVVAREVKELAQRSHTAAEQVSGIVESLQASNRATGDALHTVISGIDKVGELQLGVNKIVDDQVAQVELIHSLTGELAGNVDGLTHAVGSNREAATGLSDQCAQLRDASAHLDDTV